MTPREEIKKLLEQKFYAFVMQNPLNTDLSVHDTRRAFEKYMAEHVAAWHEDEVEKRLAPLREAAKEVMDLLAKHGPGIVPHLMDTDENAGQRLRELLESQQPEGGV